MREAMVYCHQESAMEYTSYHAPIMEGRKKKSSKLWFVILLLAILLGVPSIIASIRFFPLIQTQTSSSVTPAPTRVLFPTDTPTPIPSPTVVPSPTLTTVVEKSVDIKTGINRKDITVIVENGSGKVGAAQGAATLLKELGYTVVQTRNADAYAYIDVTISVKAQKKVLLEVLEKDLSSVYTISAKDATLLEKEEADALVIIGK